MMRAALEAGSLRRALEAAREAERILAEVFEAPGDLLEAFRAPAGSAAAETASAWGELCQAIAHLHRARDVLAAAPAASSPEADDTEAGMAWFNGLTRAERAHWLALAGSAVPADAWRAFRDSQSRASDPSRPP
jgi:hypothetical protein